MLRSRGEVRKEERKENEGGENEHPLQDRLIKQRFKFYSTMTFITRREG